MADVPRWQGLARFTLLLIGPGARLEIPALIDAWRKDPQRCARLDVVALAPVGTTHPVEVATRLPDAALPGFHRTEFGLDAAAAPADAAPRAVLTLAVGAEAESLLQLHLTADAIWLSGIPQAPLKSLARLAGPEAALRLTVAPTDELPALHKAMHEAGFQRDAGTAAAEVVYAVYRPGWPRPGNWPDNTRRTAPAASARNVLIIGAGLAGACTAWSLARRGWAVTLLDAGAGPASGASGLPAGLMVPHVSPDDAPMSRLTRQGAALMREWMNTVGLAPEHWHNGVLQVVEDRHKARAPAAWGDHSIFEWRETPGGRPARFFPRGCAVEPGALVRQLLATSPRLLTRWHCPVHSVIRDGDRWTALDAQGRPLAQAHTVVIAAALDSLRIARQDRPADDGPPLRAVRGQITLGPRPADASAHPAMPPQPLSGDGHFIPAWQSAQEWGWLVGASFERGETRLVQSDASRAGNLGKLNQLSPAFAAEIAAAQQTSSAALQEWVGVRCVSPDRLPLVGPWPALPGVHVLAALGSRGLSLAAICAELLACQLDGDPWPVEASLVHALAPSRVDPATRIG